MFNKKTAIIIFLFSFIPTGILILILDFIFKPNLEKVQGNSNFSSEIPAISLINDLSSSNSIVRRQAIEALGFKKSPESVSPLFLMMMSDKSSENDLELIVNALYNITDGKVVEKAKDLLGRYALFLDPSISKKIAKKDKDAKEKVEELKGVPLTLRQRFVLLSLLSKVDMKTASEDDSFEFLNIILLKDPSRDVINKAILTSGKLGVQSTYSTIRDLFKKEFFYKISSIYALKRIVSMDDKNKNDLESFLIQVIDSESHPIIQQESHLALYNLLSPKKANSEPEIKLINTIALLNSPSISTSMLAEQNLLTNTIDSKFSSIINFFAFYKGSGLVRFRLLNVVYSKKMDHWIDKKSLYELINNRYSTKISYITDSVNVGLKILGNVATEDQDIRSILAPIYDKRFSVSAINALSQATKLKDASNLLKSNTYYYNVLAIMRNPSSFSASGPIIYRLKGFEGLNHLLNEMDQRAKLKIFESLRKITLSGQDVKLLKEKYESYYNDQEYKTQFNSVFSHYKV